MRIYGEFMESLIFALAFFTHRLITWKLDLGAAKVNMLWDGSAKYALLKQSSEYPVSVTYYGNIAVKTVKNPDNVLFKYESERGLFLTKLMIARKIMRNYPFR